MSASDWTCLQIMHDMGFPQYQSDSSGSQGYKCNGYTSTKCLIDNQTDLFHKTRKVLYNTKKLKNQFYKAINVINTVLNCDDGSSLRNNDKQRSYRFWIANFKFEKESDQGEGEYTSSMFGGSAKGAVRRTYNFLKNLLESEEIKKLKKSETDEGKDLKFSELKTALKDLENTSETLDKEILTKVLEGFNFINDLLDNVNPPSPPKVVNLLEILKTSKQLILQGPPGTGKTREAKILAAQIIGCKPERDTKENLADTEEFMVKAAESELNRQNPRICMVQFHPSYGYEDFVTGISIDVQKNQMCAKNGILKEFAQKAAGDSNQDYLLIIDEINRAPLASVLGELLYALEYRDNEITIQSSDPSNNKLSIPENLYIIGTMNTADRSLTSMDYALRRRFAFVRLNSKKLSKEDLGEKCFDGGCYEQVSQLFKSDVLIKGVDSQDIMPGQSYFIFKGDEHKDYKITYELAPMLTEYYKDGFFRKQAAVEGKQAAVEGQRISEIFASTDSIVKYLKKEA